MTTQYKQRAITKGIRGKLPPIYYFELAFARLCPFEQSTYIPQEYYRENPSILSVLYYIFMTQLINLFRYAHVTLQYKNDLNVSIHN